MAIQTDEVVPGEVSQAQWNAKFDTTTKALKDLGGTDNIDADALPESAIRKWAGETGATLDQTGAEMKTALEALAAGSRLGADKIDQKIDNKFMTDAEETKVAAIDQVYSSAEKTKLTGIEDSAKDDQTGAEIRDLIVALGDTERKILITLPETGEFKVISIHRNAAGNLEYKYDDVAV